MDFQDSAANDGVPSTSQSDTQHTSSTSLLDGGSDDSTAAVEASLPSSNTAHQLLDSIQMSDDVAAAAGAAAAVSAAKPSNSDTNFASELSMESGGVLRMLDELKPATEQQQQQPSQLLEQDVDSEEARVVDADLNLTQSLDGDADVNLSQSLDGDADLNLAQSLDGDNDLNLVQSPELPATVVTPRKALYYSAEEGGTPNLTEASVRLDSLADDSSTLESTFEHQTTTTPPIKMGVVPEDLDSRSSFDSCFKAPLAPDGGGVVVEPIVAEEDSSQSSFKAPVSRDVLQLLPEGVAPEEDSQSSVTSVRSAKRRWDAVDPEGLRAHPFSVENLFEYQWPQGGASDYFILQEQISEYLGVKSFKRKYPDLQRRQVEMDEKEFLKERGVVTETQCDLGLTALRADEVIDLMVRDYLDKYQEYEQVLHEKEKRSINEKHRGYATPSVEKSKLNDFIKKSIKSAAEWNLNFNRERKEDRKACFDLQTNTIHYPISVRGRPEAVDSQGSNYPLAVLTGQFQEHYRKYTPVELKYLPLNTVLYGPRKCLTASEMLAISDGSYSDSDDSSCSDGSSSDTAQDGSGDSTACESGGPTLVPPSLPPLPALDVTPATPQPAPTPSASPAKKLPRTATPRKLGKSKKAMIKEATKTALREDRKLRLAAKKGLLAEEAGGADIFALDPSELCRICHLTKDRLKDGKADETIDCSLCQKWAHAPCLDFSLEMVCTVKAYQWQCMDCKQCMVCVDPYDEDKMMFCDKCDRGYHTFCVGLKNLPSGPWICVQCGRCGSCGSGTPGAEGSKAQWYHDYYKNMSGLRELRQTLCLICASKKTGRSVPNAFNANAEETNVAKSPRLQMRMKRTR